MRLRSSGVYPRPVPVPTMPPGLAELMEGLTRNVLKHNPHNMYEFCANHMAKLLEIRDGRAPTQPLTLDQKIARAQEIVRQRAEERRQKYDNDMKLFLQSQQKKYDADKVGESVNQIDQETVLKAPIHHEQDITDALEVEIFRDSIDNANDPKNDEIEHQSTDEIQHKEINNESHIETIEVPKEAKSADITNSVVSILSEGDAVMESNESSENMKPSTSLYITEVDEASANNIDDTKEGVKDITDNSEDKPQNIAEDAIEVGVKIDKLMKSDDIVAEEKIEIVLHDTVSTGKNIHVVHEEIARESSTSKLDGASKEAKGNDLTNSVASILSVVGNIDKILENNETSEHIRKPRSVDINEGVKDDANDIDVINVTDSTTEKVHDDTNTIVHEIKTKVPINNNGNNTEEKDSNNILQDTNAENTTDRITIHTAEGKADNVSDKPTDKVDNIVEHAEQTIVQTVDAAKAKTDVIAVLTEETSDIIFEANKEKDGQVDYIGNIDDVTDDILHVSPETVRNVPENAERDGNIITPTEEKVGITVDNRIVNEIIEITDSATTATEANIDNIADTIEENTNTMDGAAEQADKMIDVTNENLQKIENTAQDNTDKVMDFPKQTTDHLHLAPEMDKHIVDSSEVIHEGGEIAFVHKIENVAKDSESEVDALRKTEFIAQGNDVAEINTNKCDLEGNLEIQPVPEIATQIINVNNTGTSEPNAGKLTLNNDTKKEKPIALELEQTPKVCIEDIINVNGEQLSGEVSDGNKSVTNPIEAPLEFKKEYQDVASDVIPQSIELNKNADIVKYNDMESGNITDTFVEGHAFEFTVTEDQSSENDTANEICQEEDTKKIYSNQLKPEPVVSSSNEYFFDEIKSKPFDDNSDTLENISNISEPVLSDIETTAIEKSNSMDESTIEDSTDSVLEPGIMKTSDESAQSIHNSSTMDLETAAITIQKVFRTFLFKSRASTFDDTGNEEINLTDEDIEKEELEYPVPSTNLIKERRPLGMSRMDTVTVLQTVNEEKSLSLSTDDSSTLSSAATVIQAHVRGYLVRNKLNSNKTASSTSLVNSDGPSTQSSEADNDQQKNNKTILNIHILPEGGQYLSRDESIFTSMDLSLDGSPPSSTNLHPLGYDKSERRKQLKREDAIQSMSPPSNNSGKLSEDSVKEALVNDSSEQEKVTNTNKSNEAQQDIDMGSGETTPTKSTTVETVIEAHTVTGTLPGVNKDNERRKRSLTKMSSDESDVVTPFIDNEDKISSTESDSTLQLLHSGEFHDVALPTIVSRSDPSVVREFKNVVVKFLLWNKA